MFTAIFSHYLYLDSEYIAVGILCNSFESNFPQPQHEMVLSSVVPTVSPVTPTGRNTSQLLTFLYRRKKHSHFLSSHQFHG